MEILVFYPTFEGLTELTEISRSVVGLAFEPM